MRKDPAAWPPLGWESRTWAPRPGFVYASPRRLAEQTGDYDVAVVPPIARAEVPLPAALAARAEEATRAITAFDHGVGARLTPYTAILLRSESAASSRIENLTASARAITEAEIGENTKANPRTILGNVRAMEAALAASERLDVDALLSMQHVLLVDTAPRIAGRLREEQVWIGGSDLGPRGALFVPPVPEDLPAALDDLVSFMRRTDIPPLVHAALTHAQFETIHPFADGNGRTGRALLHAQLRHCGVATHVTVPISTGLLVERDAYFDALTSYRQGRIEPIVDSVTRAAHLAVDAGTRLVDELDGIRSDWDGMVTARADSGVWRVLDLLVRQPVVDAPAVARELVVSDVTARSHLRALVDAHVVVESTGRSRNRVWRAPAVLEALDEYAEGVGRRH